MICLQESIQKEYWDIYLFCCLLYKEKVILPVQYFHYCLIVQSPQTHGCCTSVYSPCAVSLDWLHGRSSTCGASSRQRSWSSRSDRLAPFPQETGSCLPVSKHIPASTLLGLASTKQQQVGLRGSKSSFKGRECEGFPDRAENKF